MNFLDTKIQKTLVATLASAYFLYYVATPRDGHFIDAANLVIHEGGHYIFFWFGTFMYILGGSLFQVLLPAIFSWYFFTRREYFSASLVLFWVGQNMVNVSVYAGDAVKMQLPLLGGDTSGHDWHNLLSMTHLLPYTDAIALTIYMCGVTVILAGVVFSFLTARVAVQSRT